jgi:hypothetical protein
MAPEQGGTPPPPEVSLPDAPDIDRRIRIPAFRAIGMAVIALIPVLAVAGVFGERWSRATAHGASLEVGVEFPTRCRYRMLNSVTATVTNRSPRTIDTVTVRLDTAYALRFSTVVFTPAAQEAYSVPLTAIASGETRLVVIELQGERYGRHAGRLRFESTSGDSLSVRLHTLIFP